jgi:hypothetical protein
LSVCVAFIHQIPKTKAPIEFVDVCICPSVCVHPSDTPRPKHRLNLWMPQPKDVETTWHKYRSTKTTILSASACRHDSSSTHHREHVVWRGVVRRDVLWTQFYSVRCSPHTYSAGKLTCQLELVHDPPHMCRQTCSTNYLAVTCHIRAHKVSCFTQLREETLRKQRSRTGNLASFHSRCGVADVSVSV